MKQEVPEWYSSYSFPSPWTWRDIGTYPYRALRAYFVRLELVYGLRLLIYMGVTQIFLKGAAMAISLSATLPLFKNVFGVEASSLQLYMVAIMVPWSLKPVIGLLSDFIRICGYRKRHWLLFSLFLGCLGSSMLFGAYATKSPGWFVCCFTFVMFEIALFDLMTESAYSAINAEHPYTGPDVVTLTQIFDISGGLFSTTFVGALSDAGAYQAMFGIILVLTLIPLPLTLLNWIGEVPSDKLPQQPQVRGQIILIAIAGISAPFIAVLSNTTDPAYAAVFALLLICGCVLGAFATFPRIVADLALYQVLVTLSRPSLSSALDYFYTGDATCLPGGPNFSYAYYQTIVGIVSELAALAGVLSYQWLLGGMRYRRVVLLTGCLRSISGASDLWIVLRWNIALGIPDKVAYMIGEAMLEPALTMLNYIVGSVLISKVVTKGMESSIYAFMAGIYNFSYVASRLIGALIYEGAGIQTIGVCNFNSLWWLILICHIGCPLMTSIPAMFLIPDVHQDQPLVSNVVDEPVTQLYLSTSTDLEEDIF